MSTIDEHRGVEAAELSPATNVVVRQCPCGTAMRNRSPRRQRPRSRAIFVFRPFGAAFGPMARPRLTVDEDQPLRVEVRLRVEPGLAGGLHIIARLLARHCPRTNGGQRLAMARLFLP